MGLASVDQLLVEKHKDFLTEVRAMCCGCSKPPQQHALQRPCAGSPSREACLYIAHHHQQLKNCIYALPSLGAMLRTHWHVLFLHAMQ
jgi:hypothetical protein